MKRHFVCAFVAVLAIASNSVFGFQVYDSGYTVETYASYTMSPDLQAQGAIMGTTFDGAGNLYVVHKGLDVNQSVRDSSIVKVDTSGNASMFVSGHYSLQGVAWGGGTGYGNSLYYIDYGSSTGAGQGVYAVDAYGNESTFTTNVSNPSCLAIDDVGNYGNEMYVGWKTDDRITQISPLGGVSTFSGFPYNVSDGMKDIAFDNSNKYGGSMYVASNASSSSYDGIFSINASGVATSFTNVLNSHMDIEFGSAGFNNDMFVLGRAYDDNVTKLFTIDTNGDATLFAVANGLDFGDIVFGQDGAMYAGAYNHATNTAYIYRISAIPEPCTMFLFGLGALVMRKRR